MNTISRKISGSLAVTISKQAAERLDSYKPKGCPHSDYTLLDLLKDFIQAYSWKIDRGHTISLSDFIRQLQAENYADAVVYGKDMVRISQEVWCYVLLERESQYVH